MSDEKFDDSVLASANVELEFDELADKNVDEALNNEKLYNLVEESLIGCEETSVDITKIMEKMDPNFLNEQKLAFWYSHLTIYNRDLVNEIGGNECIFISFEALILRFTIGGKFGEIFNNFVSPLTVLSRIENFLLRLESVGIGSFYLISFECFKPLLCCKHPSLWTLRQSILIYCLKNKVKMPISFFSSWKCDNYKKFIESKIPFIFFCEDGSNLKSENSDYSSLFYESMDQPKGAALHHYGPFYSLIGDCLRRNITVALLCKCNINSTRVDVFCIERDSYDNNLKTYIEAAIEEENQLIFTFDANIDADQFIMVDEAWDIRTNIMINVFRNLFTDCDEESKFENTFFVKVFLMHLYWAENMSLELRKSNFIIKSEKYHETLTYITLYIQNYLTKFIITNVDNISDYQSQLKNFSDQQIIDLMRILDENVFRRCFDFIINKLGGPDELEKALSDSMKQYLNQEWQKFANNLDLDTNYFPILLPKFISDDFEKIYIVNPSSKKKTNSINLNSYTDNSLIDDLVNNKKELLDIFVNVKNQKYTHDCLKSNKYTSKNLTYSLLNLNLIKDYDRSHTLLSGSKKKVLNTPNWIASLAAENQVRAYQKWLNKVHQEKKVFARNVNKYMGGLDKLHKPIVLISGKCSNDHPWKDDMISVIKEDKNSRVKEKKKKIKISKIGTKAAEIIEKNNEQIRQKEALREVEAYDRLISALDYLFKKKSASPKAIYNGILQIILGSRDSRDTTVLENFSILNQTLKSNDRKIKFVCEILKRVKDCMLNTWKMRKSPEIEEKSQILLMISLTFRIVHVTIIKYLDEIPGQAIIILQEALILLGMKKSASLIFKKWANRQLELEAKTTVKTVDKVNKTNKNKKNAQSSIDKMNDTTRTTKSVDDISIQKKLKEYEVSELTANRKFDYALKPNYESTFQLKNLGADMTRSLGSKEDNRVVFTPDSWQIQLLDSVDNFQSCLVVAPTASGKTFICYYAMDQVLRYDNESCVVFISPTRALALQVEAEVIARFSSKSYPSGTKTTLCGHLFDDRNQEWDNCQILITIPQALETILNSKDPKMMEWQRKLKYVIIDEIHCIGEASLGEQFQNLIHMLPCPFIALSATVANAYNFSEWLKSVQSYTDDKKLKLIIYRERYADLRTFYFSSQNLSLYNMNPIQCVSYERALNGSLIADFMLTQPDCVELYEKLVKIQNIYHLNDEDFTFFIENWDPEVYFYENPAITKKEYSYYFNSLCHSLYYFIKSNIITNEIYDTVLNEISMTKLVKKSDLETWYELPDKFVSAAEATKCETNVETSDNLSLHDVLCTDENDGNGLLDPKILLALIRTMEKNNLLPALVFNFNRSLATRTFHKLLHHLLDMNHDYYHGTPELSAKTKAINKKREDQYKDDIAKKEMIEKYKLLTRQQREELGIDDQYLSDFVSLSMNPPGKIEDEHHPDFFLCDKHMYNGYKEEVKEIMQFCKIDYLVRNNRIPEILVEALRRGIGLYHDALHREYRRAVEYLFRLRYLRVIISDKALSIGINMPCRTTVFAGDSTLLTPLSFRQTSGRAGRRGYDALGNVVFWECPMKKISYLLCSKLPSLTGDYPIHSDSVLSVIKISNAVNSNTSKVKNLYTGIRSLEQYKEMFFKMFKNTLYDLSSSKSDFQLEKIYNISILFTADLLIKLGILKNTEKTTFLSSIVDALKESDNNGLFLSYCILNGYLFIDENDELNKNGFSKKLVDVLIHCVQQKECNYTTVRKYELAQYSEKMKEILFPYSSSTDEYKMTPFIHTVDYNLNNIIEDFDNIILKNTLDMLRLNVLTNSTDDLNRLPITDLIINDNSIVLGENVCEYLMKSKLDEQYSIIQSLFETDMHDDQYDEYQALLVSAKTSICNDILKFNFVGQPKCKLFNYSDNSQDVIILRNSYILELLSGQDIKKLIFHYSIHGSEIWSRINSVKNSLEGLYDALDCMSSDVNLYNYTNGLKLALEKIRNAVNHAVQLMRA